MSKCQVVELGPDTVGFSLGDRVMALVTGGGYADLCVCPAATAMRVPEALSWVAAAGVCETFLTAFQLLHIVGQVC
jgi:NADPH:quinone reductase-like Zn-dependent oxidoreductase